jgi:NAD(P)-dependent dehydrogenase (short-subunit alcohol dehydrogenase family)
VASRFVHEIEAQGRKAAALALDVGNVATIPAFICEPRDTPATPWKRNDLDFLVNNAGFGLTAPFVETTEEMFDQLTNVHLKGGGAVRDNASLNKMIADQTALGRVGDAGRRRTVDRGAAFGPRTMDQQSTD